MSEQERRAGDRQLDRLLGAQIRAPSAEFDERLEQLIANLTAERQRVIAFPTWAAWASAAGAVAAALVLGIFLVRGPGVATGVAWSADPSYEELFVLEDDVGDALPLTDPLVLDAILNMPNGTET